jgi:hypothetical protein
LLTLWSEMTAIVFAQYDGQKTEGWLNVLPWMCQLWHVHIQPSANVWCFCRCSCLQACWSEYSPFSSS